MIVAGGSAGVNRIFRSFGFRPPSAAEQEQPKPAYTDAWFAVTLVREKARGPVNVLIGPPGAAAVAGTITGTLWKGAWWRFFLRDKGRFPQSGGHAMPAASGPYEVVLQGVDGNKNPVASATWGPYPVSGGGIIDIELTV